eukprot:CAMPEP_0114547470 /NCGR_PEP_ID=MMETSP0114-20121206/4481_1 /TAXON_ID=31324 /ORGANISM="Goniomonas sp, Strain m" /LENGTH=147 /DNA_ID=CAMNT_0001732027 /DNA_START=73 /DNA_END=512 /DNA_ORIENTATION=-
MVERPASIGSSSDLVADVVVAGPGSQMLSGIGITVRINSDERPVVEDVVKGGPGDRAKLKEFDIFSQIDGRDVSGLPLQEVNELLLGKPGTTVRVMIEREKRNGSRTMEMTVKRTMHASEPTGLHKPGGDLGTSPPPPEAYRQGRKG